MADANVPLHEQIRQDLLAKINSGVYPVGKTIPKEIELVEQYGVSRPTVRQAIKSLVDEGYLDRKQRFGTIVKQKKVSQDFTTVIESFDSEMVRKGLLPTTRVLAFHKQKPNNDVAEHLKLTSNDYVYKLIRLRYVEQDPIVLVTTYLPEKYLPCFMEHDFQKERLYATLEDFDVGVRKIWRRLEVLKADETTAALLEIENGDPIFYFHSIGYTKKNLLIEYSIAKYRGDMNSFAFSIERQQKNLV